MSECVKALQDVAQRRFGVSILKNIQNLTEQPDLADPVLSKGIGPNDYQRYIPPAAKIQLQWFCEHKQVWSGIKSCFLGLHMTPNKADSTLYFQKYIDKHCDKISLDQDALHPKRTFRLFLNFLSLTETTSILFGKCIT